MDNAERARLAVAREALRYVSSGQVVGVGTGSTAMVFLRELRNAIVNGDVRDVLLVPTSTETEVEIMNLGLSQLLRYPWQVDHVDVAVDGADEVDKGRNLLKGGGGALTREKIVDYWAREFVVIVDEAKLVERIPARHPIPIEVLPFAWTIIKRRLETGFGGKAELRFGSGKRGPVVTDNGNYILDYTPSSPIDPVRMETEVKAIPGVVEVGLFSGSRVTRVIVGRYDGSTFTL